MNDDPLHRDSFPYAVCFHSPLYEGVSLLLNTTCCIYSTYKAARIRARSFSAWFSVIFLLLVALMQHDGFVVNCVVNAWEQDEMRDVISISTVGITSDFSVFNIEKYR